MNRREIVKRYNASSKGRAARKRYADRQRDLLTHRIAIHQRLAALKADLERGYRVLPGGAIQPVGWKPDLPE